MRTITMHWGTSCYKFGMMTSKLKSREYGRALWLGLHQLRAARILVSCSSSAAVTVSIGQVLAGMHSLDDGFSEIIPMRPPLSKENGVSVDWGTWIWMRQIRCPRGLVL